MPVDLIKSTAVAQQFTEIVADYDRAATDEFPCVYCGGRLEAAAPLWFNVRRGPGGTPVLDVYGVGVESSTVSCAECGRGASIEMDRLITDAICPWDGALTGMEV
ncbi:hypothetical protein ADK60_38605 [Streptomyces sp. XY431]|uniref:hypothetical protein n=1 Tax=Streptomyces sp. XY431 TaxID=1415562 RepID=UPI0006AE20F0|nr:hypothetical protein [Streptomyces sp. XY431]KOV10162.1 hypothetical protein ADK60_38605 [Streptomyces sp. XY431]